MKRAGRLTSVTHPLCIHFMHFMPTWHTENVQELCS